MPGLFCWYCCLVFFNNSTLHLIIATTISNCPPPPSQSRAFLLSLQDEDKWGLFGDIKGQRYGG